MYQKKQANSREEEKRLFFGAEVLAPWPDEFPTGRTILEQFRHITLAFLGHVSLQKLLEKIPTLPLPTCTLSPLAKSESLLFLPEQNPRVVSLNIAWLYGEHEIISFWENLRHWLQANHYRTEVRAFLPHATL